MIRRGRINHGEEYRVKFSWLRASMNPNTILGQWKKAFMDEKDETNRDNGMPTIRNLLRKFWDVYQVQRCCHFLMRGCIEDPSQPIQGIDSNVVLAGFNLKSQQQPASPMHLLKLMQLACKPDQQPECLHDVTTKQVISNNNEL